MACQLVTELGFSSMTTPVIWCDNISASALAVNPVFHARTKHIEIYVHFIRDHILRGALEIRYVPSSGSNRRLSYEALNSYTVSLSAMQTRCR